MEGLMNVEEAKEMCLDRTKYRSVISVSLCLYACSKYLITSSLLNC